MDAFTDHPDDAVARAAAYEAGSRREVEPWYDNAIEMDKMGSDPAGSSAFGGDAAAEDGPAKAMAAVFVAAATDPIIGRGIAKFMNLLQTPAQLMADPELIQRIGEVMSGSRRGNSRPAGSEGPGRRELLAHARRRPPPPDRPATRSTMTAPTPHPSTLRNGG